MMILRRHARIGSALLISCLLFGNAELAKPSERPDQSFKLELFPFQVEHQNGKPVFHVKVRLTYLGKSPIRMETYENLFVPSDAGFLQRSIYFASDPALPLCSMRQVWEGQKYPPPLSKTMKSGDVLEEEWVTKGIDMNPASFKNPVKPEDGGVCLNQPGKYRIKVLFWATNPKDQSYGYLRATSNEEDLEIPGP